MLRMRSVLLAALCAAALCAASCSSPAKEVEGYIEKLEHADASERRKAALALAGIGKEHGAAAVPALRSALDDSNWKVKNAAAHALKRIETPEAIKALEQAVPYYISALQHGNEEVRWYAADGLGYFGIHAAKALPALVQATSDPSEAVQNTAAFSLRKIASQMPQHQKM